MEESGAAVAWRLLATLEGTTLLLIIIGLVVHSVRARLKNNYRNINKRKQNGPLRVLVTNQHVELRDRIVGLLEAEGCTVMRHETESEAGEVDVLVVIGSNMKRSGLDGLSDLVGDDVFGNLKVTSGGRVLWVSCRGATDGASGDTFSAAADAFDQLVKTQLQQIAVASRCEAVWVGRHKSPARAAKSVVEVLIPTKRESQNSIRTLAARISDVIWRWIKIT